MRPARSWWFPRSPPGRGFSAYLFQLAVTISFFIVYVDAAARNPARTRTIARRPAAHNRKRISAMDGRIAGRSGKDPKGGGLQRADTESSRPHSAAVALFGHPLVFCRLGRGGGNAAGGRGRPRHRHALRPRGRRPAAAG